MRLLTGLALSLLVMAAGSIGMVWRPEAEEASWVS